MPCKYGHAGSVQNVSILWGFSMVSRSGALLLATLIKGLKIFFSIIYIITLRLGITMFLTYYGVLNIFCRSFIAVALSFLVSVSFYSSLKSTFLEQISMFLKSLSVSTLMKTTLTSVALSFLDIELFLGGMGLLETILLCCITCWVTDSWTLGYLFDLLGLLEA